MPNFITNIGCFIAGIGAGFILAVVMVSDHYEKRQSNSRSSLPPLD
jgi:hypothetical protein